MPVHLGEEDGGKVLVVHVSGKLVKADYEKFVPEFDRLVREHGKVRLLFDMKAFHGWDAGAAWEDFKLGVQHFADIERLAMVGDTKWQHGMARILQAVYESGGPVFRSVGRCRGTGLAGRSLAEQGRDHITYGVQVPAVQSGVAPPQTCPQYPQWAGFVFKSISHPSACLLLLQSPNPASHTPDSHEVDTQARAMWFVEHARPQAPQLSTELLRSISQPSARLSLLQSAKPFAQFPTHDPPAHVGVGTWLEEQVAPHPPQLTADDAVLVSHPFVRLSPSQSPNPAMHAPSHVPPLHARARLFVEQA